MILEALFGFLQVFGFIEVQSGGKSCRKDNNVVVS